MMKMMIMIWYFFNRFIIIPPQSPTHQVTLVKTYDNLQELEAIQPKLLGKYYFKNFHFFIN